MKKWFANMSLWGGWLMVFIIIFLVMSLPNASKAHPIPNGLMQKYKFL
ncbi:hypothetical protein [Rhodocytophaga rosea]|nr:hypothetical protein [Rhodocytophaga rosea]